MRNDNPSVVPVLVLGVVAFGLLPVAVFAVARLIIEPRSIASALSAFAGGIVLTSAPVFVVRRLLGAHHRVRRSHRDDQRPEFDD